MGMGCVRGGGVFLLPLYGPQGRYPLGKGEVGISRDLAAVVWRLSRLLSGFIRGMGESFVPLAMVLLF